MAVKKKTSAKSKPKAGIIKKAKKVIKAVITGAAGGAVKGAVEAGMKETNLDKKPLQTEAEKGKTTSGKVVKSSKVSKKK